jgi:SulP family sulfate permease
MLAGFTVAVIALPFALAVGIGSLPQQAASASMLAPPVLGAMAAIVGGLLLAVLGGSRVQVGGPSAVSIAILYTIARDHGYQGLVVATVMAGCILVIMGVSRLGVMVKYIPYPVTAGFTAGSAVLIATAQGKDMLGLAIADNPAHWVGKVQALAAHISTAHGPTLGVGLGTLVLVLVLRRFSPRLPAMLLGLACATLASWLLSRAGSPVPTIASQFGSVRLGVQPLSPSSLSLALVRDLVPAATTIAILVAIEGLLTDVVADGMTGGKHRSDQELVSFGIANIACGALGLLPVAGGLSRTVANVKAGARTPFAAMWHALCMLLIVVLAGSIAGLVPLAALAAVLVVVSLGMMDFGAFRQLLRTPRADVAVLLTTFGLTVVFGLVYGVGIGMVLASMLFMQRMSEVAGVRSITHELRTPGSEASPTRSSSPDDKDPLEVDVELAGFREGASSSPALRVPPGVEVFELRGPFFFAVADKLEDTLAQMQRPPKVFILRMRGVPHIDATGLRALERFHAHCTRLGTTLLLGGVHAQPLHEFVRVGLDERLGEANIFENLSDALARAQTLVEPDAS